MPSVNPTETPNNLRPLGEHGTASSIGSDSFEGRLTLWPAFVIVALQWVAVALTLVPSINNALRFGIMMGGPAICFLLYLVWCVGISRLPWRELGILVAAIVGGALAVGMMSHSTMMIPMWIYGIPVAMTIATLGLWLRQAAPKRRAVAVAGTVVAGWLPFAAARLDGFDGSYWPEFRWRGAASVEQGLVASGRAKSQAPADAGESLALSPGDWPGFRGAMRDSRVLTTTVADDWSKTPPKELWRIPIGAGWASFASIGPRLFTQEQRGDNELVVCYDAATGKEIWRHADPSRFTDIVSGAGPRATPTFDQGKLYTLGGRAVLNCFDAATGKLLWNRDLMKEINAPLPVWGFSASPLVTAGVVIVFAGGSEGRGWVAYDAISGEPKWHAPASGMNFTSAQSARIADKELALLPSQTELIAVDPATGSIQWRHEFSPPTGMAICQPQQVGETSLVVPCGDGAGVAMIDVKLEGDAWKIDELWRTQELRPSFNDFVYHEGHLYGFNQNIFVCLDAKTGKRMWKRGRYGFGQVILLADQGRLLVAAESGELVLLEANPKAHVELAKLPALQGKTWNHPIVVGQRMFLRNSEEAVCLELPPSQAIWQADSRANAEKTSPDDAG